MKTILETGEPTAISFGRLTNLTRSRGHLIALGLLACAGCGEGAGGTLTSTREGEAIQRLDDDPPRAGEPASEMPVLLPAEAEVIGEVLNAFVELYGSEPLIDPQRTPPPYDLSALEARLDTQLTGEQKDVLDSYARNHGTLLPDDGTVAPHSTNLYAVGDGQGDSSSDFYRITVTTSIITLPLLEFPVSFPVAAVASLDKIGETHLLLSDLAYDYNGGDERYYAIDLVHRLFRINGATGATTYAGNTGWNGLNALTKCGSSMYSWGISPLVILNLATGNGTQVGDVGLSSSGDLACDPRYPNWLFGTAASSPADMLIRIDPATGSKLVLGSVDKPQMYGLTFGEDGYLYAGAHTTNSINISVLSPKTGGAIFVGTDYPTNAGLHGMTARYIPL